MIIRTKTKVTYNSGVKGTVDSVVVGTINNASWMNDFNSVGVNYQYKDDNGNIFHSGSFTINNDQIDAMHESIKDLIPTTGTYIDIERTKFYLGFALQMSVTFGIEIDEIEIVS